MYLILGVLHANNNWLRYNFVCCRQSIPYVKIPTELWNKNMNHIPLHLYVDTVYAEEEQYRSEKLLEERVWQVTLECLTRTFSQG